MCLFVLGAFWGKNVWLAYLFNYFVLNALFKDRHQFCLFLSAGSLAILPELSEINTSVSSAVWATSFSSLARSPASLLVWTPLSYLSSLVTVSVPVWAETSFPCHQYVLRQSPDHKWPPLAKAGAKKGLRHSEPPQSQSIAFSLWWVIHSLLTSSYHWCTYRTISCYLWCSC